MMKKYTWKYWFAGMKAPKHSPKGCQAYDNSNCWHADPCPPCTWQSFPRRWKVAIKLCKWTAHGENLAKNPHTGVCFMACNMKCCNTCGRPVEIVKKGAK